MKFKLPHLPKFKKPTKNEVKRAVIYWLIVVFGNMIAAFASALFIIPNNLVMGGTTGIGIFVRNFWDNEYAVTSIIYIANIILFLIGAVFLGKKFAVATLAGTLLYPTFIQLGTMLNESTHLVPSFEDNLMLAVIFGALMFGFGIGMVVRVGASTGGTDIPPLIFHKYFNFPVSAGLWILDMAIVMMQIGTAGIEKVLYGILICLLSSVVIEKVSPIGMKRTQVKIVSKKHEEIREALLSNISRGVTVLYGQTGYLQAPCKMLLTIVSNRELVRLKSLVQEIDPEAFMTISVVSEVRGRGFTLEGIKLPKPQEPQEIANSEGDKEKQTAQESLQQPPKTE